MDSLTEIYFGYQVTYFDPDDRLIGNQLCVVVRYAYYKKWTLANNFARKKHRW